MNLNAISTCWPSKVTIRKYRQSLEENNATTPSIRKRKHTEPLNYYEIVPSILEMLSRCPDLAAETEMGDDLKKIRDRLLVQAPSVETTREFRLFSQILNHPVMEIQLAHEKVKVSTALLASHAEMIRTQLLHNNATTISVHLNDFSWSQLHTAVEFYKNPREVQIPPKKAWHLLHLADLLQSRNLAAACVTSLCQYIEKLDVLQFESIRFAVDSINDPICSRYPTLAQAVEGIISGFFKLSFLYSPEAQYLTIKNYIQEKLTETICVNLSNTTINEESLAALTQVKIKALNLHNCRYLDRSCLTTLKNMPWLQELDVEDNDWVDDKFLVDLSNMSRLKRLTLNFCDHISSGGLRYLPSFLEELSLAYCKGIDDTAIPHLLSLKKLKILDLTETQITETGAAQLREVVPRVWMI